MIAVRGRNYGSVEAMASCPRALAALLLILSTATLAGAQLPRFSSGTDLVILSATAVDKRGRPVTDLRREEVRVFEDGRPQKLEHFSQGRAAAAKLLLLLDASGSMTGELKSASTRMAAIQILAALDPEDEAALAAFDHKYWGVVAFTRDRRKVEQAMAEIEPFGATALHDALGPRLQRPRQPRRGPARGGRAHRRRRHREPAPRRRGHRALAGPRRADLRGERRLARSTTRSRRGSPGTSGRRWPPPAPPCSPATRSCPEAPRSR